MCGRAARLQMGRELCVSYLPLSHVAAQLLDIYCPILFGAVTHFARRDALQV